MDTGYKGVIISFPTSTIHSLFIRHIFNASSVPGTIIAAKAAKK